MKTYGKLCLDEEGWSLSKVQPHVVIKLKALFSEIPKYQTGEFNFYDSPESCIDLHWFLERYPMMMTEKDRRKLNSGKKSYLLNEAEMEKILLPNYTPREFKINGDLRHYQAQALELYLRKNILLCGDVVGLGKTLISIASLTDPKNLPAMIVVQTHLPKQWLSEIQKFMPGLRVHYIKGRKPYSLPEADVYLTKYSCLLGWVDVFDEGIMKSVTFDEIQDLRRMESSKYRAAKVLTKHANRVLGLSATPIHNKGSEIFNILDLMEEGILGSKEDFRREWVSSTDWVMDPDALGTYLRDNHIFLRRTRKEVGRELPDINKITIDVEYDEHETAKIEDLAKVLAIKATTGSFIERGKASRDLDMMVRHNTGVSKAKSVAQYVKILVESGEPVLLAGWHRDVYDIWLKEFKDLNPVMYTGSESASKKEKNKQKFINGESNLMIISLASGAGLNGLQERCSYIVFGELDWSPRVHEQLEGRLRRDRVDENDEANQVTSIYLVTDAGSDPPIIDLLGLKASQHQGIVDPLTGTPMVKSDSSRIQLLAKQYLEKKGIQHNLPMEEGISNTVGGLL